MRCRYCGAQTPEGESRCLKCYRRADTHIPIVESAAVPKLDPQAQPQTPPRARLQTVHDNPSQPRRTVPTQPALFSYREPQKLVEMDAPPAPRTAARQQTQRAAAPRRRVSENQIQFDFNGPPSAEPFRREIERRQELIVAPVPVRIAATALDAMVVGGLLAVFIVAARVILGFFPLQMMFLPYLAASALIIALGYKVLWSMFDQCTPGVQALGLRIVSFDGRRPTHSQRMVRIFLGWLCLGGAGLGILWALVDQDSLAGHDHATQTFLTFEPQQQA